MIGVLKLPSGRIIEVELSEAQRSPPEDITRHDRDAFVPAGPGRKAAKLLIDMGEDFVEPMAAFGELCDSVYKQISTTVSRPEEITIELSLSVGATGKLVLIDGSVGGMIKIGLRYRRPQT